jgi:ABC-type nickel/cobalt efflux system permease component RcnA
MSFSLDLTKPLGRLGLVVNTVVLTAVFYGISVGAFHYMSETLPESEAHKKIEAAKATLVAQAVAKGKAAAKGKAFDEKAAAAQAETALAPEFKKQAEEIHHHAVDGWAPFAIFLLILSAVFFGGFLSVFVQRRANDGGLLGWWMFSNHLGAWALAGFVAFYPFLAHHGLRNAWAPAFVAGLVLLLPALFAGEGRGHDHDHDHDHDHGCCGHGHSH